MFGLMNANKLPHPRPISGTTETDRFLDHAKPVSFRYKNPADSLSSDPSKGNSRFLGTLAQSVEQDPYGKSIVKDTPHGKTLEMKPLVSALTAGAGRLHQRLDTHEKALTGLHGLLHAQDHHIRHLSAKVDEHEQMINKIHDIMSGKLVPGSKGTL